MTYPESMVCLLNLLRLFRFLNAVALALLFLASRFHFAQVGIEARDYLIAFIWLLLAGFAYAINDYYDIAIDKVNNPARPIPSGEISPAVALTTILGSAALVLLLTYIVQPVPIWPIVVLLMALAYSSIVRRVSALASNILAGVLVACVPLSAVDFSLSVSVLLFSIGSGLLIVARELQKDVLDSRGDTGHRPLALLIGKHSVFVSASYPVILAASFVLIYLSLNGGSNLYVVSILGPLYLGMLVHFGFAKSTVAKNQVRLAKIICYLLVPLLMLGTI